MKTILVFHCHFFNTTKDTPTCGWLAYKSFSYLEKDKTHFSVTSVLLSSSALFGFHHTTSNQSPDLSVFHVWFQHKGMFDIAEVCFFLAFWMLKIKCKYTDLIFYSLSTLKRRNIHFCTLEYFSQQLMLFPSTVAFTLPHADLVIGDFIV